MLVRPRPVSEEGEGDRSARRLRAARAQDLILTAHHMNLDQLVLERCELLSSLLLLYARHGAATLRQLHDGGAQPSAAAAQCSSQRCLELARLLSVPLASRPASGAAQLQAAADDPLRAAGSTTLLAEHLVSSR